MAAPGKCFFTTIYKNTKLIAKLADWQITTSLLSAENDQTMEIKMKSIIALHCSVKGHFPKQEKQNKRRA